MLYSGQEVKAQEDKKVARYSEAHKKATAKYQKKAYDTLLFRMPKGFKDDLHKYAEMDGLSVNGFIKAAIAEKIERDGLDLPDIKA